VARYNALSLRFLRDKQFLTTKLATNSSFLGFPIEFPPSKKLILTRSHRF
jgi:hypothetical protein